MAAIQEIEAANQAREDAAEDEASEALKESIRSRMRGLQRDADAVCGSLNVPKEDLYRDLLAIEDGEQVLNMHSYRGRAAVPA